MVDEEDPDVPEDADGVGVVGAGDDGDVVERELSAEGGGTLSTGGAVSGPVGPSGNGALGTPAVAATGPRCEWDVFPIMMAASTATTRTPANIFQDVVIALPP